ncbi:MAG: protease complex subunit PrcB family protein [Firmicutes bacterium]|nr:protease complex subunit PrcB family protein [Bacillota bacterium]
MRSVRQRPARAAAALALALTWGAFAALGAACGREDAARAGAGAGSEASEKQSASAPSIRHVSEEDFPAAEMREWLAVNRQYRGWTFFTFGDTRYLMISRGESPNPGYRVEVTDVAIGGDGVAHVRVAWKNPDPGAVYAQVVSYPVDIVATPAEVTAYELVFEGEGAPQSPGRVEPNIVVTSPRPGDALAGTLKLRGRARAFEGVVQLALEDGHRVLLRKTLQGEGAPAWMSLDGDFTYDAPSNEHGMLMVYVDSARDGSKQDVVMVPVRFGK